MRLSRFGGISFLPVLASTLLVCDLPAADSPRGQPIEFSDPKRSDITTNLAPVSPRRSGLRDFEDDLTNPFRSSYSSGGSLDGVSIPPPRTAPSPALSNKKFKEALEKKRNWFLRNPDEFLNGPKASEVFKVKEYDADGREIKPRSAVEDYYERQERQLKGGIDPRDPDGQKERNRTSDRDRDEVAGAKKRPGLPDELDAKDEAEPDTEKNRNERNLDKLFDPHPLDASWLPEPTKSTAADIFGLGIKPLSPAEIEASKNSLKEYGQFLSTITTPAPVATPPNSLSGVADLRPSLPANTFETTPVAGPSGAFDFTPGTLSSVFGLPDAGIKGIDSQDSSLALPKVEQPKFAPPAAAFDFPRRKF